jgi:hypothetical protein
VDNDIDALLGGSGQPPHLHEYKVGALYNPGITRWQERVAYLYRGGGHELVMFLDRPTPEEVEGVRTGRKEFAVAVVGPIIFFLYRFGRRQGDKRPGDAIPWGDAPFSWWLLPEAERSLPNPEPTAPERPLLSITLVDAATGIIKLLSVVSLEPVMAAALNAAIRAQASDASFDTGGYDRALQQAYGRYPDSADLLSVPGAVRGVGGE